jgi:acyl-CoA reductase-like NAD-dependent aldehyde dehydrogenase
MSATDTSVRECRLFVGGDWIETGAGRSFDDLDPYTGDVVAHVPAADRSDAARAVEAASAAFAEWSRTPPAVRQRVFLMAADILEARTDDVVGWLARETGCSFGFGMFQMGFVPGLFRQAAGAAYAPYGQIIPADLPGSFSMGIRRPAGVVGAIAPWNAALILSARSIAAPLVFGNTVVLKPSEESPYAGGLLWGEIFAEAGLPDGVLNVVTHAPGEAGPIGDELVENPLVRRINFTGSTATGRKLAEAAGRNLKRIVLELGGFNPLIVLADADLEYAVSAAAFGAYLHQGQICMSARRIIVERPIAEEFTERLAEKTAGLPLGDPKEPATIIGPLISAKALETVKARVDEAVAGGECLRAARRWGRASRPR